MGMMHASQIGQLQGSLKPNGAGPRANRGKDHHTQKASMATSRTSNDEAQWHLPSHTALLSFSAKTTRSEAGQKCGASASGPSQAGGP